MTGFNALLASAAGQMTLHIENKREIMRSFAIGFCLLFLLAGMATTATAQTTNMWKKLADVTYKKEYDELLGFKVDVPVFSQEIRGLAGKEITIKGYIVPVEGYKSHKEFVFSAYPYNMCFFCGGAGPETVMEVAADEPIKYTTEPIIIKGKLQLNDSDVNRLMYILTNATLVKGAGS